MANKRWETAEDRYGRNLRRMRDAAGLSQAELAQKLAEFGVSLHPSAIAKIEARDAKNPRTIRLNEADGLARSLGVPLANLLSGPHEDYEAVAELVEQAVHARESADRWIEQAFDRIRTFEGFSSFGEALERTDPNDVPALEAAQNRIIVGLARLGELDEHAAKDRETGLAKLEELNGEHHEET